MTFGPRTIAGRRVWPAPQVGDQVEIVAGRHAGSRGELVRIERVPTPTGLYASIAVVRRPRAGDTMVFVSEVRKREG